MLMKQLNYGSPVNMDAPLNYGLRLWWYPTKKFAHRGIVDLCNNYRGILRASTSLVAPNYEFRTVPKFPGLQCAHRINTSGSDQIRWNHETSTIAADDILREDQATTIVMWVNPTAMGLSNAGTFISRSNATTAGITFGFAGTGTQVLRFSVLGSTNNQRTTSTTISLNVWTQVAVTYTGDWTDFTNAKIYIDGIEAAYSATTGNNTPGDNSTAGIVFGARGTAGGGTRTTDRTYQGSLTDCRIYNRVLDIAEIQRLREAACKGYVDEIPKIRRFIFQPSAGTSVAPADLSVAVSIDTTTITQHHVVAPADLAVAVSIDTTTITQHHVVTPADLAVAVSIDTTTITQHHVVAPADLSVSTSIDTTTVNQAGTIVPDDLSVAVTIDSPTIVQHHVVAPADLSVAVGIDTGSIVQHHVVAPADLSVAITLDSPSITQGDMVIPADLSVSVTIDSPTVVQHHFINPADITINVAIDGVYVDTPRDVIEPHVDYTLRRTYPYDMRRAQREHRQVLYSLIQRYGVWIDYYKVNRTIQNVETGEDLVDKTRYRIKAAIFTYQQYKTLGLQSLPQLTSNDRIIIFNGVSELKNEDFFILRDKRYDVVDFETLEYESGYIVHVKHSSHQQTVNRLYERTVLHVLDVQQEVATSDEVVDQLDIVQTITRVATFNRTIVHDLGVEQDVARI